MCMKISDKFAPRKNKYSRGNNKPFMNKLISRVHISQLRDCYIKKRSEQNSVSQQNNVIKNEKENCANLNEKDIPSNKQRQNKPLGELQINRHKDGLSYSFNQL